MPWLVLAGIVLVALVLKGYIKLPASGVVQPPAGVVNRKPIPAMQDNTAQSPMPVNNSVEAILDQYPAWQLGVAFAKAAKREAEKSLHQGIASKHLDEMMATFQSPFVAPPAPPADGRNPATAALSL